MRRRCILVAEMSGSTLAFALVALAVGTILVLPLLAHVASGYRTTESAVGAVRDQYASDAAAEYVLWRLTHDASFRQTLIDNEGVAQTVTLPSSVNGASPSVEVVCADAQSTGTGGGPGGGGSGAPEALGWVIWANSETANNTVKNTGAGHSISGGVHSNNSIQISGAGNRIFGVVEYRTTMSVQGAGHEIIPGPPDNPVQTAARPFPAEWHIEDFRPGGVYAQQAAAEGRYFPMTDLNVSGAGAVMQPGLYYCTGKASISGAGVQGISVTIIAEDTINVAGSGVAFQPYIPALCFFSPKESTANVISISGAGNKTCGGIAFAPNGRISLDGAGNTMTGAFMGNEVQITGAGAVISLASIMLPATGGGGGGGTSSTCGEYDVEATSGGTTVSVRFSECVGTVPEILSWRVH